MDKIKIFSKRCEDGGDVKKVEGKVNDWIEAQNLDEKTFKIQSVSTCFSSDGDGEGIFVVTIHYSIFDNPIDEITIV